MADLDPDQKERRTFRVCRRVIFIVVAIYVLGAYLIAPRLWKRHEARLAQFADAPRVTHTASGIPGDPLNIGLLGAEEEIVRAMIAAGWDPADPLTFRSSVRIVVDTILRKPDDQAPVSNLFLFGRKEDLAFEKPVGGSPKERHHVRFWKMETAVENRTGWIGSAAFDIGVELSRTTGQVTHHISPDIDAERDLLVADLTKAAPATIDWLDGFQTQRQGRNGGGDAWRTDERLAIVILSPTTLATSPSAPNPK